MSDPTPPPDARKRLPPASRRGVFRPSTVRIISFAVISLWLFAVAFLCVLAVWDYTESDVAWKSLATLGIVVVTMVTFTVINEIFGERAED